MGLCKCSKRNVTNQFCFEHSVNVCEYCMVQNHRQCVVRSYLQWLKDSEFDPKCTFCYKPLEEDSCVRLMCYHVYHESCMDRFLSHAFFGQSDRSEQSTLGGTESHVAGDEANVVESELKVDEQLAIFTELRCSQCTSPVLPAQHITSPVVSAFRTYLRTWVNINLVGPVKSRALASLHVGDDGNSGINSGALEFHRPQPEGQCDVSTLSSKSASKTGVANQDYEQRYHHYDGSSSERQIGVTPSTSVSSAMQGVDINQQQQQQQQQVRVNSDVSLTSLYQKRLVSNSDVLSISMTEVDEGRVDDASQQQRKGGNVPHSSASRLRLSAATLRDSLFPPSTGSDKHGKFARGLKQCWTRRLLQIRHGTITSPWLSSRPVRMLLRRLSLLVLIAFILFTITEWLVKPVAKHIGQSPASPSPPDVTVSGSGIDGDINALVMDKFVPS